MHLLLEGSDLQELLNSVREQHGSAARVVRAERIRSGGVAGFFSKERYEVTVEMDGAGAPTGTETGPETRTDHSTGESLPDPTTATDGLEQREALDFEALLAAADAAESTARSATGPDTSSAPSAPSAPALAGEVAGEVAADEQAHEFEAARAGLLEVLRASGSATGPTTAPTTGEGAAQGGLKVPAADAEYPVVIAQTGDTAQAEPTSQEAAEQAVVAFEDDLLEQAQAEIEQAEAERAEAERAEVELAERRRAEAERAEAERVLAERAEAERVLAERAEAERAARERAEVERAAREREAAERALEEERMQQQLIQRQQAERQQAERAHAERQRAQRTAEVRRRQAERMEQAAPRSLGDVLAAADAAEGTDRLGAMFAAGQQAPVREVREVRAVRPHRPISTESDSFARTMASMRSGATRTPATGVTADVRSVTTSDRPVRPRQGRPEARPARTPEERVSDQFGAPNGATAQGRGPARRPELRRPAAVEDQFADQFGDQFGDRFETDRREWAHDYDALEQTYEQTYEQPYAPQDYERQEERVARSQPQRERLPERGAERATDRSANDNEAMTMDLTYREPVSTYSERQAPSRVSYREPQDTGDVLRLARDIDVPAPLRVGAGELVVVIGEADAVVAAALLVADEVGSEAPLVLGRADVQNTVTADELPARQEQARRWSAPLTVAIPARPTGADAERAARMAAEVGAASVVVCVDATRRSHAVASLLRALDGVGLPARRLAVHRAAESPDPLDVLSLDVPVGFLDGRPATSGAWAGLLLDAAGDPGLR
ncbi:hypothetical protein CLV37_101439 [Kineococcus rhizosphaerae]|uniref:Uncharacterized protein n=2 Tax=Kineococcus rhizosphaerae TaxID=559628 RepID=A0A2T0RAK8_9ACTN|nr:hypothetical protein CLV37_101439 [Kineococcus rhizosphaerae]